MVDLIKKNFNGINTGTLVLISVISFALVLFLSSSQTVSAAYNGAHLIDNQVFIEGTGGTPSNTAKMSKTQIQSFLSSKGSGLSTRSFKLDCYGSDSKERQWFTSIGAPCDKTIPAAHIIYYVGRIYGINPQVILATIQKEQSLVTSSNPTSWQINNAMGYNCPTSGSCSSPGFFTQIDHGTWVLRYHYERARGNMTWWRTSSSWTCGVETRYYKPSLKPGTYTRFYDGSGVHYRTHKLANPATSALYCYTPHAYNNPDGLYGLPRYGTKGQYYSGSYNFTIWFQKWFGSVYAKPLSFEAMEQPRWMEIVNNTQKKNLRLGVGTGGTLKQGEHVYFKSKVLINGEWYLRSTHDTNHKLEIGVPISDLKEITPEYISLEEPREMRISVDTYNKQPITSQNIDSIPRGTKIYFDTKTKIGNSWYFRSQQDTTNDSLRGIPESAVYEVLTYDPLERPRWMEIKRNTHKIDPQNRRHIGPTLQTGREIEFDTKIVYEGKTYLRSSYDTSRDMEQAVLLSDLKELNPDFVRLKTPRWMQLSHDARLKNPASGENIGSLVSSGEPFFFSSKVELGDWYLRPAEQAAAGSSSSFLLADIEELEPVYEPLAEPRSMTLRTDAHKQHVATRNHVGPVLKKGQRISFSTKIKLGEVWYLRSSYDTSRDADYVIPISKLRL